MRKRARPGDGQAGMYTASLVNCHPKGYCCLTLLLAACLGVGFIRCIALGSNLADAKGKA